MKLVIFDMDGTLVDSAGLMVESATAACVALGLSAPDPMVIRSISGLTLEAGLMRILPGVDEEMIHAVGAAYREAYTSRIRQEMREPLFPGIYEAVLKLHARDDTLLAVATGKGLHGAERVLAAHGIRDYFVCVQTPDTNRSKPDPDMILRALGETGIDRKHAVMVGDTNHDMEMAVAAKVKALGVAWGYHPAGNLEAAGADMVIDRQADLVAAVDGLLGLEHA